MSHRAASGIPGAAPHGSTEENLRCIPIPAAHARRSAAHERSPARGRARPGPAAVPAGALRDAETLYRQVTAAYPDAADGWNMLALLLCQRGALHEAAQASRRATALRATIAPYWLTAGNIAMARQQHEEAQAAFRRATRLDPTFAVAHYRLGLSHHRQLAYAAAADCYRRALRYAPDVAEIHAQLAEAYGACSRRTRAWRTSRTGTRSSRRIRRRSATRISFWTRRR